MTELSKKIMRKLEKKECYLKHSESLKEDDFERGKVVGYIDGMVDVLMMDEIYDDDDIGDIPFFIIAGGIIILLVVLPLLFTIYGV